MNNDHHEESYWTGDRKELRDWFRRNAPSLGGLYEGALRMIFDASFPGRVRFVAHAVREIRNSLPDVIAGQRGGGPLQYKNLLDPIVERWKKEGLPMDGTIPVPVTKNSQPITSKIPISKQLYREIAALIKKHLEAREKPKDSALRLFEAISPDYQNQRDYLRPVINQWIEVSEWFVSQVHDPRRTDSSIDERDFKNKFELFEEFLKAIIREFFKTTKELDEILEAANS